MRSRKYPTSAAAEDTIGRTQDVIEIAVQLAPMRTATEAYWPVGSGASGRCSRCVFSTLSTSEPPGAFRNPCLLRAEPRSAAGRRARNDNGGLQQSGGKEAHRRFHAEGSQRQPVFHFHPDEPEFHQRRSHFGLWPNQLRDGVMQALTFLGFI